MMGTEMVPETMVTFNQLLKDFIKTEIEIIPILSWDRMNTFLL